MYKLKKYRCSLCKEPGHNKNNCQLKYENEDIIKNYILHRQMLRNDINYRLKNGSIELIENFRLYDENIKNILEKKKEISYLKYSIYKLSKKLCKDPDVDVENRKIGNHYMRTFNNKFITLQSQINNLCYKRKFILRYKKRILTSYYLIFKDVLINSSDVNNYIETNDNNLNFWFNLKNNNKVLPNEISDLIISYLI
tara:strand:- start:2916 stop:3506 length:591 start_codon:yes stop_codon:yes gene_type:complete